MAVTAITADRSFDDGFSQEFILGMFFDQAYPGFGCECIPLVSVTRIDSTHLQIDFSESVLVLPTLTWIGAYEVTPEAPNTEGLPELVVTSVTLGTITPGDDYDSVDRVTLTTSEQGPIDYDVTIFGLETT